MVRVSISIVSLCVFNRGYCPLDLRAFCAYFIALYCGYDVTSCLSYFFVSSVMDCNLKFCVSFIHLLYKVVLVGM